MTMRGFFASSLFIGLLLATAGVARADDVADGKAAFKRKDYATALKLLEPRAQQGDVVAEIYMGLMYFAGHGVAQDYHQAAHWFAASARQGNVGAQTDLGIAYATGNGVPRDLIQAYLWFSLAAAQDNEGSARYRDHVASEMTPEQMDLAQKALARCRDSNLTDCGSQP